MAEYKSLGFGVETNPKLLPHGLIEFHSLLNLGFLIPKAEGIANGGDRADHITWMELMQCSVKQSVGTWRSSTHPSLGKVQSI